MKRKLPLIQAFAIVLALFSITILTSCGEGGSLSPSEVANPAPENPEPATNPEPDTGTNAEDKDGDGIANSKDNCPDVANEDQADADQDGLGDACDAVLNDKDGDGVPDAIDNCPDKANKDQKDSDKNGKGNACDILQIIGPYIFKPLPWSLIGGEEKWTKVVDGDIRSMDVDDSGKPIAVGHNGSISGATQTTKISIVDGASWTTKTVDILGALGSFPFPSKIDAQLLSTFSAFPVSAVAKQGSRIYVGTSGFLLYSDDDGASWDVVDLFRMFSAGVGESGTHATCSTDSQHGITSSSSGQVIGVNRVCDIAFSSGNVAILAADLGTAFNTDLSAHINNPMNAAAAWQGAGSALKGHIVHDLAVLPGNDLYAGTDGGVWRSYDGGASWGLNGLGSEEVFTVFSPDGLTNYAGTADALYSRAVSNGTWQKVRAFDEVRAVSGCGTTLMVGTSKGVFKSVDKGKTWTDATGDLPSKDVRAVSCDGQSIYAATAKGLYSINMK